jgi:DNA-binding response OmpR family regulator
MKILLLEDDVILNEIIEEFLLTLNYEVVSTHDGEIAEELIYEELYDLLIFDVNVPSLNGFALLEKLRNNNINIPTIFITSLNTIEDLQTGFKVGCDDYIKKPFELTELSIRINNIKKLKQIDCEIKVNITDKMIYNFSTKIISGNNSSFQLSKIESKVFEYFLRNKNRTLSIEEISINNWAYDEMPEPTTVRTYIKNLRKILGNTMIINIKGIGYKLVE